MVVADDGQSMEVLLEVGLSLWYPCMHCEPAIYTQGASATDCKKTIPGRSSGH